MPVEPFIRNNSEDNIFFTAAINEGIRHFLKGPAEYMIILNQDMYLAANAVAEMVNFMNRNPGCGIGAPLQLHPDDHNYAIWAGCFEAFPIGRHLHGPTLQFKTDELVYWANGACMILRRAMIEEIGLLDKNLIFIGSDSDYSLTARSRGWEVWRIASASGIHEHGASGISNNPHIELLKVRDMIYFGKKWLTGDLYRYLTHEGAEMTSERIQEVMDALMDAEKKIRTARDTENHSRQGVDSCVSH